MNNLKWMSLAVGLAFCSSSSLASEELLPGEDQIKKTPFQRTQEVKNHVQKHTVIMDPKVQYFLADLKIMKAEALVLRSQSDMAFNNIANLKADYQFLESMLAPEKNKSLISIKEILKPFFLPKYNQQHQMAHIILEEVKYFIINKHQNLSLAKNLLTRQGIIGTIKTINKYYDFMNNYIDTVISIEKERREFLSLFSQKALKVSILNADEFRNEIKKLATLSQSYSDALETAIDFEETSWHKSADSSLLSKPKESSIVKNPLYGKKISASVGTLKKNVSFKEDITKKSQRFSLRVPRLDLEGLSTLSSKDASPGREGALLVRTKSASEGESKQFKKRSSWSPRKAARLVVNLFSPRTTLSTSHS